MSLVVTFMQAHIHNSDIIILMQFLMYSIKIIMIIITMVVVAAVVAYMYILFQVAALSRDIRSVHGHLFW